MGATADRNLTARKTAKALNRRFNDEAALMIEDEAVAFAQQEKMPYAKALEILSRRTPRQR